MSIVGNYYIYILNVEKKLAFKKKKKIPYVLYIGHCALQPEKPLGLRNEILYFKVHVYLLLHFSFIVMIMNRNICILKCKEHPAAHIQF